MFKSRIPMPSLILTKRECALLRHTDYSLAILR